MNHCSNKSSLADGWRCLGLYGNKSLNTKQQKNNAEFDIYFLHVHQAILKSVKQPDNSVHHSLPTVFLILYGAILSLTELFFFVYKMNQS